MPAIDLIEGKCVRLTEGDYAQKKIYNEDPLEVAKAFEGYKGGRYKMNSRTPVWVANWGENCHSAIVGVRCDADEVLLAVARCEY